MLIFWALLLRVAAAVQPSVGVCVVLTNIDHKKQESFAELASLLASLDGQHDGRARSLTTFVVLRYLNLHRGGNLFRWDHGDVALRGRCSGPWPVRVHKVLR